jgi:hypothetical protein
MHDLRLKKFIFVGDGADAETVEMFLAPQLARL